MTRKVALLVVTDGLCWIPICILFFLSQIAGQILPDSTYIITACVLLPINSALNPLIYSQCGIQLVKSLNLRCFGLPGHFFSRKQVAKAKANKPHVDNVL